MGSKSTFAAAGFGGVQGRELVGGDILSLAATCGPASRDSDDYSLPSASIPTYTHEWRLAALPGPCGDADYLRPEDLASLYSTTYTVSSQANRLGIRLEGLKPLKFARSSGGSGGSHPSNTIEMGYSCVRASSRPPPISDELGLTTPSSTARTEPERRHSRHPWG